MRHHRLIVLVMCEAIIDVIVWFVSRRCVGVVEKKHSVEGQDDDVNKVRCHSCQQDIKLRCTMT